MPEPIESILCTRCGLCCNGSFFEDVELSRREASRMELAGLEIEDDSLLLQPCSAVKGKRCSIYSVRPKCCRTFECLLLQRARRGEVSIETAQQTISVATRLGKGSDAFRRLVATEFLGAGDLFVTRSAGAPITTRHA